MWISNRNICRNRGRRQLNPFALAKVSDRSQISAGFVAGGWERRGIEESILAGSNDQTRRRCRGGLSWTKAEGQSRDATPKICELRRSRLRAGRAGDAADPTRIEEDRGAGGRGDGIERDRTERGDTGFLPRQIEAARRDRIVSQQDSWMENCHEEKFLDDGRTREDQKLQTAEIIAIRSERGNQKFQSIEIVDRAREEIKNSKSQIVAIWSANGESFSAR